jgi:hypothetical protein
MIRAFGVALGIPTTRPIVGEFYRPQALAARIFRYGSLAPLTLALLAAETWIHYTQSHPLTVQQLQQVIFRAVPV